MRPVLTLPVLQVVGVDDPAVSLTAVRRSARHVDRVAGSHDVIAVDRAGHFPHEEQPEAFTAVLLDWLARVAPTP
jgi:pimeloyl-ACP methyl ester carboxylesterase